ncbi:MAG: PaaI family thioesterase [Rhodospirillales bacterium]|nr:PaaI family thioesterase [Rhodospirillales bacterium]
MPKITIEDFNQLLESEMPWALEAGMFLEKLGPGTAKIRIPYNEGMLRPGGTISGPTMMMLADALMYAVVLSEIGKVALAVTTSFNINFLKKPRPADLIAEGKTLKIGRRLAVVEVSIFSDGHLNPVAHATGTYSIPPNRDT